MDIVISDAAVGHTLVDIVVVDPTRRDFVERAARQDLVAATDAERRKETHYRDRATRTKFVPFGLESYGALLDRSDRFLVECATLASKECARSEPSISLLCTWFRQRVSTALQRSLAHAIHARTLRLEQSMALLPPPPPRVPLSSSELHIVASFVQYDRHTYLSFLGYVGSLRARFCNEMGFPTFFNNIQFLHI